MLQLGTCIRLNARISQRQCDINRKGAPGAPGRYPRPPCLSCDGCEGLQSIASEDYQPQTPAADTNNTSVSPRAVNVVSYKEDKAMAKTITCKTCKRKNMSLASGGECGRCYSRRKAGKDPLTNEPIIAVAGATEAACKDNVELLSIQKPSDNTPPQEAVLEPASSVHTAVMAYMDAPAKPDRKREPRPHIVPETITLQFATARDAELFARLHAQALTHRRTIEAEILFQLEDQSMHIESLYLQSVYGKEAEPCQPQPR